MSKKDSSNRVAIALITDDKDNVLMGCRNDNGRYTFPAGHLKINECPFEGGIRETKEETGLDVKTIKMVTVSKSDGLILYLFKVTIDPNQEVDTSKDPDMECDTWIYQDPNDVKENLHVPLEKNIALKYWANN